MILLFAETTSFKRLCSPRTRGVHPPNSHDATFPLPSLSLSRGSGGVTPANFLFGIKDARRRVLEHFGRKKSKTFMSQVF